MSGTSHHSTGNWKGLLTMRMKYRLTGRTPLSPMQQQDCLLLLRIQLKTSMPDLTHLLLMHLMAS